MTAPKAHPKTRRCPECGEFFSPQGLGGHLRFSHGADLAESRELAAKAAEEEQDTSEASVTGEPIQHGPGGGFSLGLAAAVGLLAAAGAVASRLLAACPSCGHRFRVPPGGDGAVVRCPRCNQLVRLGQ